jgi:hypothetical protein
LIPGKATNITFDPPGWVAENEDSGALANSGSTAVEPIALRFLPDTTIVNQGRRSLKVVGDAQPPRFQSQAALVSFRLLLDQGRTIDFGSRTLVLDVFIPTDSPIDWFSLVLATGDGFSGPNIVSVGQKVDRGKWSTVRFCPSRDKLEYVKGTQANNFANSPQLLAQYLPNLTELRLELWTLSPPQTMLTIYVDNLRWE